LGEEAFRCRALSEQIVNIPIEDRRQLDQFGRPDAAFALLHGHDRRSRHAQGIRHLLLRQASGLPCVLEARSQGNGIERRIRLKIQSIPPQPTTLL